MKLSEAKTANAGFEKLTVTVRIDKQQLYPGCLTLKELHVDTSCELKTNTAELLFCDITDPGAVKAVLQSGACITIEAGYQKTEELLFQGYVHTITLRESGSGSLQELELYAQDVKGLMMLHKRCAVESGKTKNALLQDILNTALYAEYTASVSITPLAAAVDTLWSAYGFTDYDILQRLCSQTLNTCFVRGDTLCFEPRFTVHSETMELDAAQEVYRVECRYTIQDLIGNVQTAACDGFTEKKAVQESIAASTLPYTQKLSNIVKHTSTSIMDDGFHDMEELKYMISGIKKEVENSYAKCNGQCVVLPWLLCGSQLILPETGDRDKIQGYVIRVIHHIDHVSAYTEWEAVIQKG